MMKNKHLNIFIFFFIVCSALSAYAYDFEGDFFNESDLLKIPKNVPIRIIESEENSSSSSTHSDYLPNSYDSHSTTQDSNTNEVNSNNSEIFTFPASDYTNNSYGYCGDGTQQYNEDCDDGNNDDGDGCSSDCKTEAITNPTPDFTPNFTPPPVIAPTPDFTPDFTPPPAIDSTPDFTPTPDETTTPDPTPDFTPTPDETTTPDPTPDFTPTPDETTTPDPTPDFTPTPDCKCEDKGLIAGESRCKPSYVNVVETCEKDSENNSCEVKESICKDEKVCKDGECVEQECNIECYKPEDSFVEYISCSCHKSKIYLDCGSDKKYSAQCQDGVPKCCRFDGSQQKEICDGETPKCTQGYCGDGIYQRLSDEECDDGNNYPGDGCDEDCKLEGCGDGKLEEGEECDDGNRASQDGCSTYCEVEYCGDGELQEKMGEECDDGNKVDNDECSNKCKKMDCNKYCTGIKDQAGNQKYKDGYDAYKEYGVFQCGRSFDQVGACCCYPFVNSCDDYCKDLNEGFKGGYDSNGSSCNFTKEQEENSCVSPEKRDGCCCEPCAEDDFKCLCKYGTASQAICAAENFSKCCKTRSSNVNIPTPDITFVTMSDEIKEGTCATNSCPHIIGSIFVPDGITVNICKDIDGCGGDLCSTIEHEVVHWNHCHSKAGHDHIEGTCKAHADHVLIQKGVFQDCITRRQNNTCGASTYNCRWELDKFFKYCDLYKKEKCNSGSKDNIDYICDDMYSKWWGKITD